MKKLKSVKRLINIDGSTPGPFDCKESRSAYLYLCERINRKSKSSNELTAEQVDLEKKLKITDDFLVKAKDNFLKKHPKITSEQYDSRLNTVAAQWKIVLEKFDIISTKNQAISSYEESIAAANRIINSPESTKKQKENARQDRDFVKKLKSGAEALRDVAESERNVAQNIINKTMNSEYFVKNSIANNKVVSNAQNYLIDNLKEKIKDLADSINAMKEDQKTLSDEIKANPPCAVPTPKECSSRTAKKK